MEIIIADFFILDVTFQEFNYQLRNQTINHVQKIHLSRMEGFYEVSFLHNKFRFKNLDAFFGYLFCFSFFGFGNWSLLFYPENESGAISNRK